MKYLLLPNDKYGAMRRIPNNQIAEDENS